MDIDTGDTVRHRLTGEEWLVAGVEDGRLMWCGWPEGSVHVTECELVEKAKPGERDKLLHELAAVNRNDRRACFARRALHREAAWFEPPPCRMLKPHIVA